MGRPSLSGEASAGARSPLVCLRFPPDELATIDRLAKRAGVGRSVMLRQLIELGRKALE